MMGQKWTVYWSEYSSDTYLYGSEIDYHKMNDVEFKNNLMPSGTVIKQWYSKTNYQKQRIEPALPIIDGENRYQITVNVDCPEEEAWLVRLVFYDKYDVEAGYVTVRDKVMEFQCPLKTYSYKLQLINGGMKHFHFRSIVIQEIENETEKELEKTKKNRKEGKKLWRTHGRAVR
ncbi:accessory Sec system protein Asp3 [Lachnospiraceae bacterium]|jgi:accessory secretory protein Asp3|nr:accessory Sec system protein Asp3 [uncultured Schaedlerella sp.]EOS39764.1 accessory Sec system protein Asp3 [Lachnospiraceae bacterium M18-1]NBI60098.1 accessory Sec system protein Asp3 [Lachnospiraceae bacterium]